MKYFTLKELTTSLTAISKKLDNTPSKEHEDNLKTLVEKVLDPLRELYGKAIRVSSGYRSPAVNKSVNGATSSQHCLDLNTEILTNNGWKTIDTIREYDQVFSMNMENGMLELTPIEEIVKYDYDGMLNYTDTKHVLYAVTGNHRMVVRNVSNKYTRTTDRQFSEKELSYFDSLKSDNDKFHIELADEVYNKRRIYKTAGISSNKNNYDIDILRMCMAVISDGFLYKKPNRTAYGFNLKKDRDKEELEDILNKLKWKYSKTYSHSHENNGCSGVYLYYINSTVGKEIVLIIGLNKKIPNWFLSLDPTILRQLVITYAKFDGSIDNRNGNQGITIFSKDNENIDMLLAMCILCGMRCVKKTFKDYKTFIDNKEHTMPYFYHLYISKNTDESRVNEKKYRKFYYKAKVWCVNNRNTTLITRRNGKVVILGNSLGEASDITVGNKEGNKKLFELIRDNLEYDQLINEYDYSWIHVSYRKDRLRKLILVIK